MLIRQAPKRKEGAPRAIVTKRSQVGRIHPLKTESLGRYGLDSRNHDALWSKQRPFPIGRTPPIGLIFFPWLATFEKKIHSNSVALWVPTPLSYPTRPLSPLLEFFPFPWHGGIPGCRSDQRHWLNRLVEAPHQASTRY